ncbi:MAG: helix-turn-helix domain-containing protein [Cytophagales bacterium]|nr:MAG: helix-turn-helix domain-containing protein [Cytophagales bacterium]TAF59753.1 MAG: helix-turn-helix domain-containing protein [Cytophagales bacterium]
MVLEQGCLSFNKSSKGEIRYSNYTHLGTSLPFDKFSIKLAMRGLERYKVNDQLYELTEGSYLLANQHVEGSVFIESKQAVAGLCIDIDPLVMAEVCASILDSGAAMADPGLDVFFTGPDFFDNKYHVETSALGTFLKQTIPYLSHEGFLNEEFYLTLAEYVVSDHLHLYKQFQRVAAVKSSTRKHLLRCVERGRQFMDAYFEQPLGIEQVAKEAAMSQYHFFRLFRNVYGQSPYQYINQKKFERAFSLLISGHYSVSEVATSVGFSDIYVFSKAFKKHFGMSPSQKIKMEKG